MLGENRRCAEHRGFALASASTLNRLELSAQFEDYYRKVHPDAPAVEAALLEMGVRCLPKDAEVLALDFDATDDPPRRRRGIGRLAGGRASMAGRKAASFTVTTINIATCLCSVFAAMWSGSPVSLPPLVPGAAASMGAASHRGSRCQRWHPGGPRTDRRRHPPADAQSKDRAARRLPAPSGAALRAKAPPFGYLAPLGSGFAREAIMAWCEAQKEVYYCIGLARNGRLEALLSPALAGARAQPFGELRAFGTACAAERACGALRS